MDKQNYTTRDCLQCHLSFQRLTTRIAKQRHFCSKRCQLAYWHDLPARFWEQVAVQGRDCCWLWQGCRTPSGYGTFQSSFLSTLFPHYTGHNAPAHRVAHALNHGPMTDPRILVCHQCDNPPCVNDAHLFEGSHADNTNDMIRKGRMNIGARAWQENHPELIVKGIRHPFAKLTAEQVEDMRALYAKGSISCKALGAMYGICAQSAWQVVTYRSYKS